VSALTWALWGAFAVLAVLDWWAVATRPNKVEVWAKPGAMLALIGVALASGAGSVGLGGGLLLVALGLCLAGDILLLADTESRFLAGLGAFLLGHLAYAALFLHLGLPHPWWGVIGVAGILVLLPFAFRIVRAAAGRGVALGGAVTAYIGVIGAMAVLGWATGNVWLGVGALVFVVSDTILGFNQFVRPVRWGPVAVMVTYLFAQALLVVGALGALSG